MSSKSWGWRSIHPSVPIERFRDLVNTGLLSLENALGRTPIRHADMVVTADTVLTGTAGLVLADTTTGTVVVTLPVASINRGMEVVIKKMVAGNTLTVDTLGSDEVEGAASESWTTALESRRYRAALRDLSDGYHWVRV